MGAEGSLVGAIFRGYSDPRASMARQFAAGPSEPRALVYVLIACVLGLVASLPNALRVSGSIAAEDAVSAAIAAHLFGYLFLAPLLLYGVAALVHLSARAFGGRGGFLEARMALAWALLLGVPIALALSLLGVVVPIALGPAGLPAIELMRYAGLAFWLWLFAACLAEAEGFPRSGRVAVAVLAAFAALAVLTTLLAGRVSAE
jgi:Yip1 domain